MIFKRIPDLGSSTSQRVSKVGCTVINWRPESKGYEVAEVCREIISGTAVDGERHGLARVEQLAAECRMKKVLVHEISRIVRKIVSRIVLLRRCRTAACRCTGTRRRLKLCCPAEKRNPAAGIVLALLAEMARNETETLRERIKSGLTHARKNGVVLGLPKGTTLGRAQFLKKHRDIVRQSVRNTARIVGKGVLTVQLVKAALGCVASA
jgi:DNA invertase Pin-like site-specific DNA recombinase